MTALKKLLSAVALGAALLAPGTSFAAQTVIDTRCTDDEALMWVQSWLGAYDATQSTATKKVYNVMRPDMKNSQIIIDDIKGDSVHFRLIKN